MGELSVAPCSYKAARYAVEHWHYSKRMPQGRLILLGVWEHGRYVGAVLYGRGASDSLLKPYGLTPEQGCELVRIALRDHESPVTQVVATTMRYLRRTNPGLRLVVSFADPRAGHHGGIYQAGNWIYTGTTAPDYMYRHHRSGRELHSRQVSPTGIKIQFGRSVRVPTPSECERVWLPGKHRYLMPLDRPTRRRLLPLSKPYPRAVEESTVTRSGSAGEVRVQLPATAP